MTSKIQERAKIDQALVPQTINNSNATGYYFPMRDFRRALAVLAAGATAATKNSKLEFLQAQDAGGTGSKPITPAIESTVTANNDVIELTVTLSSVANGEAITVNGVTFTAHTDTTTAASRQFKIDGNDAADATALAGLINDADYGVPGVTASVNSATITLKASRPSEVYITASSVASTFTIATTKHQTMIELSHFDLDSANGFEWIACKVTTTGNTPVGVLLVRDDAREAVEN